MSDDEDNGNDNWFDTGENVREDVADDGDSQRFFMKVKSERTILFLDGNSADDDKSDRKRFNRPYSAPFALFECQIPTNGPDGTNWRNWVTSLRGRRDAHGQPLKDTVRDEAPDLKPYYVGFFTVLDLSQIERLDAVLDKGKPISGCRRMLYPAKRSTLQTLKRHAEKKGGLRGCIYDVFRGTDKSPNVGDDFQFVLRLTDEQIERLFPDDFQPFDYRAVLKPKSDDEIKALLNNRAKVTKFGRDDDRGGRGGRGGGRGRDRDDSGRNRRDDSADRGDRARRRRDEDDSDNDIKY
jgi:hypothetical protein